MPIRTIDREMLKIWRGRGEAVLVGVRELTEHMTENIPDAKFIPLRGRPSIMYAIGAIATFERAQYS